MSRFSRQVLDEYKALLMMRARVNGRTFKEIANFWFTTPATVSAKINRIASECMRDAMRKTQSDPEHPATARFRLEDFTADPRGAMLEMMADRIQVMEMRHGGAELTGALLSSVAGERSEEENAPGHPQREGYT